MSQDIYVCTEHLQGKVAEITYVMLAAAREMAQGTGGNVVAVLPGYNAQPLAGDMNADQVLYIDHEALAEFTPDAYMAALSGLITENEPRAVLFGHTSIGMDIAGGLSVKLSLPLVCQVRGTAMDNGSLRYISQICGGKIMAEGELPSPTALVTIIPGGYKPEAGQSQGSPDILSVSAPALDKMRVKLIDYIQPEVGDVDISKEPILISVGRGIQTEDNIELAEELAELLGGVVSSSRPIVDQGWLPVSRMVGKSGQSVKAKIYLALGISGAPEHVEGITGSEMIIAVNTDPTAPIFDLAQYGAQVDLLELVEVIIEKVEEAG